MKRRYIRKTTDLFVLMVNHGKGWEEETTEESRYTVDRKHDELKAKYPNAKTKVKTIRLPEKTLREYETNELKRIAERACASATTPEEANHAFQHLIPDAPFMSVSMSKEQFMAMFYDTRGELINIHGLTDFYYN